ncbi:MAG: polysaccharide deacetylase family protein [Chthoniobacterales bacterium]
MSTTPAYSIFADPRGRRLHLLQALAVVFAITLLGASAYFISSLLIAPQLRLPEDVRTYRTQLKAKTSKESLSLEMKDDWHHWLDTTIPSPFPNNSLLANSPLVTGTKTASLTNVQQHLASSTALPIRLGYVRNWNPASEFSLKEHASLLTHVATEWFDLVGVEGKLMEQPNEELRTLCLRKELGLLPTLRNLNGDHWQPEAVETIITAPAANRQAFIDHLLQRLPQGSTGLLIEWNELDPSYSKEISQFVSELAVSLHQHHQELWITIPIGMASAVYDLATISQFADHFVATLYDQNSDPDDAGPLAQTDWIEQSLKPLLAYGKSEQWIAGLGAYSTDWNETKGTMESINFADAMARAKIAAAKNVIVEPPHFSPHFNYFSGTALQESHEVWFLDAITFFNQLQTIAPYHLGGVAIDQLGQEDPALWKSLQLDIKMAVEGRDEPSDEELQNIETLSLTNHIASIGSGDFLSIGTEISEGWRTVTMTPDGMMTALYEDFPRPACVYRQGVAGPHQVALTFDDGPDPTWTPQILKILEEKKVPATFFILGSQAQQFPDLVQRVQREGFEFGNHTYTHQNLGETSDEQICLELNATTRLIESITGHSTSLFRPPYNGDGNPSTPGELRALQVASDLGYLTVGESIDTGDWEKPGTDVILQRVKEQRAQGGSVILFHDAGGNRSQTVAALPQVIDYLRGRGDEFVSLSELIGLPKDILMPLLRESDMTIATRYIYGSFATLRILEMAAWTLLVIVTTLALLRILFFVICAMRHRKNDTRKCETTEGFPALSVVIAAYNEERVIISTIEHLIISDYPAPLELIIVDDGSHDQTAAVIKNIIEKRATALEKQQRSIRLLEQKNSGKATALNSAITASQYDFIVTLDADTMVTPRALRELTTPFFDPLVGGVSGHIHVGNPKRWLCRFQQIEYETAFEIDRRAQDLLGCITVLPGALSAFRKTALDEIIDEFNQAGPLTTETLAEDTDLTLQLHRLGWKITYASRALANTEAPESIKALISQRFRWSFGTLQCVWKHRSLTFSPGSGWLGWFGLPSIWIFQIGVIALTPLLDLMVLFSLCFGRGKAIWPYFLASLILDVGLACVAAYFANRSSLLAWRAFPMRLLYRPILGYVVWKCLVKAAAGSLVRWSKLERTAGAIEQAR